MQVKAVQYGFLLNDIDLRAILEISCSGERQSAFFSKATFEVQLLKREKKEKRGKKEKKSCR